MATGTQGRRTRPYTDPPLPRRRLPPGSECVVLSTQGREVRYRAQTPHFKPPTQRAHPSSLSFVKGARTTIAIVRRAEKIRCGKLAELEEFNEKSDAVKSRFGFPPKRRYRCWVGVKTGTFSS